MDTARSVMVGPRTVAPEMPVGELARMLLAERLDGVCVVEDQRLLGVVTSMDLIFQEKRLHMPTFFVLLDSVFSLENPKKAQRELVKISGSTVADVMSTDPVTIGPDTPLDKVASVMVEQHISVVPVIDDEDRLLGIVTKPAMLRAAFRSPASEG